MIFRAILFLLAFIWAVPAFAGSVDEARALALKGDFNAAIEMAVATQTPEGLVIAAETLSAKVMLQYTDDPKDSAKQAREWAEEALAQLPDSQEAAVQFALAYGFETRASSTFRAWRKNLPAKTYDAIQAVRTNYPDDPRGDALLGAWHLGIIRKTGAGNGAKWFDASEEQGVKLYEAALAAAPDDIVMASNYMVTILVLDMEAYYARGLEILQTLVVLEPRNAVEREVLARANGLTAVKGDKEALYEAVLKMLDGGADD